MSLLPRLPKARWHAFEQAVVAVAGADAVDLLHRLSSQNLRPLSQPGASTEALLLTPQGRVVHWLTVWSAAQGLYLAVPAGQGAALVAYLSGYTIAEQVTYTVLGEQVPCAYLMWQHAAVGADAAAAPPVAAHQARALPRRHKDQTLATPAQCSDFVLPAPSGLAGLTLVGTGSGDAADLHGHVLPRLWAEVTASDPAKAAQALGPPLKQAEWHYLRLLAGRVAWDVDVKAGAMPFEHRLGAHAVAWNKGCYIGQEVLSRLDSYNKVARLTMGFDAEHDAAAQLAALGPDIKVYHNDRAVGRVTSWACKPSSIEEGTAACVGLVVVQHAAAIVGTKVQLRSATAAAAEPKPLSATLQSRAFWQPLSLA